MSLLEEHRPEKSSLRDRGFLLFGLPRRRVKGEAVVGQLKADEGDHLHELLPVGRPALDLTDDEFSLLLQHPPGLPDEIEVVRAHQGEAKDAQANGGILERQLRDISGGDEGLGAH